MNKLQKLFEHIKTVWLIIGITIVFILAIELFCGLILSIGAKQPEYFYMPMLKAAYPNQSWPEEYVKEQLKSAKLKWNPYVYWRRLPFKGQYVNVNTQGLRKTWSTNKNKVSKTPEIMIFMFGGSTMWGEFARDNYTIPSHLSKLLSDSTNKNIKIYNYGETGYVSTQEVITLMKEINNGNIPDIVIFYDGVNDTFASLQSGVAGITHNEYKREEGFKVENSYEELAKKFFSETINNSSFFKVLYNLKFSLYNIKVKFITHESDKLADATVNYYINNIETVESLGKQYHFKTLFYWQPVVYTKKHQTTHEKEKAKEKEYIEKIFLKVYSSVKNSKTLSKNKNFFNLSDIFNDTRENRYVDECHLTENSNAIIAQRILKDLQPLINIKK